MRKLILNAYKGADLGEVARFLVISFPFDEELCSYSQVCYRDWDEVRYPLVNKGMWVGKIDLKSHRLLNWEEAFGALYFQAKVCDSGTFFLLDEAGQVVARMDDYVPNGLIPEGDDCGDYLRLRIDSQGVIVNWPERPDFSEFTEKAVYTDVIERATREAPLLEAEVSLSYSQLMRKLLKLPRHLQMEIGQRLIANASGGGVDD